MLGFLGKNAAKFSKELWALFLSAQENPNGVPPQLLEAKKEELLKQRVRLLFVYTIMRLEANYILHRKRGRNVRTTAEPVKHKRGTANRTQTADAVVVERSADADEEVEGPAGEMTEDPALGAGTIADLRAIVDSRADGTLETTGQTGAIWIPLAVAVMASVERGADAVLEDATTTDALARPLEPWTLTSQALAGHVAHLLDVVHARARVLTAVPGMYH